MPDGSRRTAHQAPAPVAPVWDERARVTVGVPSADRAAGPFRGVWEVVRGHRWRMFAVAALVVAGSAFAYPHLPRRYEAAAQLILRPTGQEGQGDFSREARNALDENGIQSEMEILGSRTLAAEVARRLRLAGDPEFNPALRPEGVAASARRGAAAVLALTGADPDGRPSPSRRLGAEAQEVEQTLIERLSVKRDRRSYVLRVAYWSEDPDKAAELTDALLAAYIEAQIERKRTAQAKVVEWLGQRVADLDRRHARSERAVQDYLVESGLVDASARSSLQQQLATLSAEVALAHSRALDLVGRARSLADLNRSGALENAPDVIASPIVQHLRERIATLSAGGGGAGGGSASAPVSAINELRQAVGAEAQRILRGAQAEAAAALQREVGLRAEVARIGAELTRRQQAETRLEALRREATADRIALEEAMARHRTEAGRAAVLQPDAEILAGAEPPLRPAYPSRSMAAFGTVALAVLAAFASVLWPLLRRRRAG